MQNVEYTFLRQREQELQRFLLEKPFLIMGISLFLFTFSSGGWSYFIPTLAIAVLIIYFKNTLIRLERIERIKAYVKFALEKDKKYIGWEYFLEKYNVCEIDGEGIKQDEITNDDFSDLQDKYKKLKRAYLFNVVVLLIVSILSYIATLIQKKFLVDIAGNFFEGQGKITMIFPFSGMIATIFLFFVMIIMMEPGDGFNKLYPIYNSRKITKAVLNNDET